MRNEGDEQMLASVQTEKKTLVAAAAAIFATVASAPAFGFGFGGACSTSAYTGRVACKYEVKDDYWEALSKCVNESDRGARRDCTNEAWEARKESREECGDVFDARRDLCHDIGEAPYDPDWDPDDFETTFSPPPTSNPYWPLTVGYEWTYEGGDETIEVVVEDKTKLIEGVTCVVVRDLVTEDGNTKEDTDDWIAQNKNGEVHYCGEIAENKETFDGDDPEEAELVDIDGSWKTGRDGAKSGILMQSPPMVGQIYREEWSFGDAEDVGEVVSTDYDYGDGEFDDFVPEDLANTFCSGDCVVIRAFSTLEPGVDELKYYAPGVGLFLEVNLEDEETVELVDCSFDVRCAGL